MEMLLRLLKTLPRMLKRPLITLVTQLRMLRLPRRRISQLHDLQNASEVLAQAKKDAQAKAQALKDAQSVLASAQEALKPLQTALETAKSALKIAQDQLTQAQTAKKTADEALARAKEAAMTDAEKYGNDVQINNITAKAGTKRYQN